MKFDPSVQPSPARILLRTFFASMATSGLKNCGVSAASMANSRRSRSN